MYVHFDPPSPSASFLALSLGSKGITLGKKIAPSKYFYLPWKKFSFFGIGLNERYPFENFIFLLACKILGCIFKKMFHLLLLYPIRGIHSRKSTAAKSRRREGTEQD